MRGGALSVCGTFVASASGLFLTSLDASGESDEMSPPCCAVAAARSTEGGGVAVAATVVVPIFFRARARITASTPTAPATDARQHDERHDELRFANAAAASTA